MVRFRYFQWVFVVFLTLGSAIAVPGNVDISFETHTDGFINEMRLQSDGKILLGGFFTNVGNQPHPYFVRLLSNGAVDLTFDPQPIGRSRETAPIIALLEFNGKLLVGGAFHSIGGANITNLARLNLDGSADLSFRPAIQADADPFIGGIAATPDDKILIQGNFTTVDRVPRPSLARLHSDGTLDTSYNPFQEITHERVYMFGATPLSNGSSLVYGRFVSPEDRGIYRHFLQRRDASGALDTSFAATTDFEVEDLIVSPSGKIYILGDFSTVDGVRRLGLARLNENGSLDPSFAPTGNYGDALSFALQPNGRLLLGGYFNAREGLGFSEDVSVIQLEPDGELVNPFAVELTDLKHAVQGSPFKIAVQPDGSVLIAGSFTTANGTARTNIVRVEAETTLSFKSIIMGSSSVTLEYSSTVPGEVVLQSSTNFIQWLPVQTNLVVTNGFRFLDPEFTSDPQRYFRLLQR